MAMSKFEIDVRAKTRALNLRVRLRGALRSSSPDVGCTARRVSGSVRARFRTWIVTVGATLLQVLAPESSTSAATVRYSLRVRLRKLWLRIRGKHRVESCSRTLPGKKPKWRRTLSSVGNQLLLRNKSSSEKITSQEPENGFMVKYMDALGADTVVMVVHGVGMVSTLIVLMQLVVSRGLPLFVIIVTGLAIVGRIVFLNQHPFSFQQLWREAISIGGNSLVLQALGAMFRPYLPQSGFTASEGVMSIITLIMVLLARYQRLPFKAIQFFGVFSAGIPAILVLWAPVVQLWNCWWSPADVDLMHLLSGLVAVVSNCFLGYSRNGTYRQHTAFNHVTTM